MAQRRRVGVLFGGRSGEHEVSLVSARGVMANLDPARWEVVPIGLARDGRWLVGGAAWAALHAAAAGGAVLGAEAGGLPVGTVPEPPRRARQANGTIVAAPAEFLAGLDVVFPVLHGPYGEDGTVQGLLELGNVPYVGCGVTASALAMDKIQTKRVVESAGVRGPAWREVAAWRWTAEPAAVRAACAELGWPLFVKPANLGSSVGISRARDTAELDAALHEAVRWDRRVIVEAAVPNPREIEIALLGNDQPECSVIGEIVPSAEFYDYEAKYLSGSSELIIPADLEPDLAEQVRQTALTIYGVLDLSGLARIDFLLPAGTSDLQFNEVNTLPGFTPHSMYPKLWEAAGLPYSQLLDRLLELALERAAERRRLAG